MPPIPRVYLAGPDVFFADPLARATAQKQVCARAGLAGVSPLDELDNEPPAWAALAEPHRIARRNEAHIRTCQAILANITPFRGPSADAGTVYEIGFGRALGLPVFGYTSVPGAYAARVPARPGPPPLCDVNGLAIEDFGLAENLMIVCGIEESGGAMVTLAGDFWRSLDALERCANLAARHLLRNPP